MPERRSEAEMTEDDDDLSGEGGDEALDDFDRLTDSLYQRVLEFTEDEDVDDERSCRYCCSGCRCPRV